MLPMLSSPNAPMRRLAIPILATLLLTGASAIALAGDIGFVDDAGLAAPATAAAVVSATSGAPADPVAAR